MATHTEKKSNNRLIIAGALFLTSVLASLLISYLSNTGKQYWMLTRPLAQGVRIESSDLTSATATLDRKLRGYLSNLQPVVGAITRRSLQAGEILRSDAITEASQEMSSASLSLQVRAADIPISTAPGDFVTLYQLIDARNGEIPLPPTKVLSGVFIDEISRKSANFGSDVSLTISVHRDDVSTVLEATSSGRIVIVASHG